MSFTARSRIFAALPALFLCAVSLHAAQVPYTAAVVQGEAEVRCKPSTDPKLYPTNRLRQGTRVLVLEERSDGWLGIQPPSGSFSWISATQVDRIVANQTNWVVKNDSAPVLIGGDIVQVRPSVEGVRLARGTQVRVIGKETTDVDGSVWLPIDPPVGEKRYLRADAVKAELSSPGQTPAAPVVTVAAQSSTGSQFALTQRTSSKDAALSISVQAPANGPPLSANATPWQKAEYYERQGQWTEAIRIYDQLGRDLKATRPDWADFANKRASYLRNGGKAPVNWSSQSSATTVPSSTSTFYATTQPQPQPPPTVRLSPPSDPNLTATQPGASPTWNSPQPTPQGMARSGVGRLVRSGYYKSGDAQYRLETQDPNPTYATPGQGVDLEQFVDRNVELYGTRQYRGDLKAYYMVVSRVQPL